PEAVRLFEIVDSAAFDAADLNQEYWIEGILAAGQPQLWGGPSKTLKTSLLVDQCLSLAAGVPFLGQYTVPEPKRVLLLSSESGGFTLQETARRICAAKGLNLAALGDHLQWGFRPPQLTDVNHLAALTEFIGRQKFDVFAIDPAYLSLAMDSAEAANQFAVGALLQRLTTLQAETGAVPVLAAHFKKFNAPGEMPTLENIAGAGFGQWARQWFLLNRQEPFNPDNPGLHKLLAAWGGSAGLCGGLSI
ncbi:MAG: AAA family ATPase, partial [Planctomyces sp.]